jgi:hypothetical protein
MTGTVYEQTLTRRTISPAVRANGTVNGAAVDRAANGGAEEAVAVIVTGTITDGSHAVAIEDSDDGTTGWAAVPAGQLTGSPPTVVAANDDTQFEVGIGASRRFVRVSITTTGATTGGAVAAVVVLGDMRHNPAIH